MKILIAGAHGQVGKALQEQLLHETSISLVALNHIDMDITQQDQVEQKILEHMPDVVINAAAYTAVDRAEKEAPQAYAINEAGVAHLAIACSEVDAVLLHISTDYVFDGRAAMPYTEESAVNPVSAYGASKLAGEQQLHRLWEKHIILRTSWVFGTHGQNFVKTMLQLANDRQHLSVVADQMGGPTAANDIAVALIKIAKQVKETNEGWGVYHYTGSPLVSWCEFAKTIFEIAGRPVEVSPLRTEQYPTRVTRPAFSGLDCQKIKKTFGINPCDWQSALRDMIVRLEQ